MYIRFVAYVSLIHADSIEISRALYFLSKDQCVYNLSAWDSVSLRSLFNSSFVLCSFCLKKPGQSSTFNFHSLLLSVCQLSVSIQPLLHQLKQREVVKAIDISFDLTIAFFHHSVFSVLASEVPQEIRSMFLSPMGYLLIERKRPSIILIDWSFMLFRSVKCHWSFIVRWTVSLQPGVALSSISPASFHQSVKA